MRPLQTAAAPQPHGVRRGPLHRRRVGGAMMQTSGTVEITIPELPQRPPSPFEITPTGMAVTGRPTLDQWIDFGGALYDLRSGLQWAIGDWINYGESRNDWGEKYDQALSLFDYDFGYLRNMASIAKQFPRHARVTKLSWSHHQAVAALPLPERKKVLVRAVKEALPRDEVRAIVKEIKEALKPTPVVVPPAPPPVELPAPVILPPAEITPPAEGECLVLQGRGRITGTANRQVFFEFESDETIQQLRKLWLSNQGTGLEIRITKKGK